MIVGNIENGLERGFVEHCLPITDPPGIFVFLTFVVNNLL